MSKNTTVSLTLQLRGQQAQQVLNQLNQSQKSSATELLRTNRLLEGVLRQQAQQTKIQSQQLQQLTRQTQQQSKNMTQTASQSNQILRTNQLLERVLQQQTRQSTLQSQQLKNQNRDYQLQVNMLRQQVAAAERLRQQLQQAGQAQRDLNRGGSGFVGGGFQTAVGVAGGAYAAGMIGSNYLKDPREYMKQVALSTDTALAGESVSKADFGQKIMQMESFVRNAAVNGGTTPQQTVQALNTLTASNVYGFNQLKAVLLDVSRTAFSAGADANDVASMAVAQKNFGLTNLSLANDQAMKAGQLGSFELRDMARYMPDILTQGKSAGYIGEKGYKDLLVMMQLSKKTAGTSEGAAVDISDLLGSFSQYHLGLSFAKHIKLAEGDPIAKYGVSKKRSGFDWTTYAANMREKGVGEVEAAAMLMQRQMDKSPLYREYQSKAQKALARGEDAEYIENVQAATQIAAQSEIGKIFHNKQALMAFMGITMNMGAGGEKERLDKGISNAAGTVDASHARQASQEYAKDVSLDTARFNARVDNYNGVAGWLGNLKQSMADFASSNAGVAAAASAAVAGLIAVGVAGGVAAMTMRGGVGGVGTKVGGIAMGAAGGMAARAGQVGIAGAVGYGVGTGIRNMYLQTEIGQKFDEASGAAIAHAMAWLAPDWMGGREAREAVEAQTKYEEMIAQQEQQLKQQQEANKLLSDLNVSIAGLSGRPIMINGTSLLTAMEKPIQTESNRHGSVPFYLQRR